MTISRERKEQYFQKMEDMLGKYSKLFVVGVDNVGSKQIQQVRMALRGKAEILMGKNTMMRKCLGQFVAKNEGHPMEQLIDTLVGNVGFVFTNGDLNEVREVVMANVVPAPARVGAIAPVKVIIPPGPTTCGPEKTSFFQTLQIATKITRGAIEITSPVELLEVGDKVDASQATLLKTLNILPFFYGFQMIKVYSDGSLFDVDILDINDEILGAHFMSAVNNIAAISLEIGIPTMASMPHSIANAFRACVAVACQCENFSFEEAQPFKDFLEANADA
uniref:Large ribosomal subunit protein uL10-like insertion domain-containing protein n=1 Tax=Phaeomonas parva TaxID=124430 RepID=A0A6U4HYH6_9STRA|mmetsp:Transcript_37823/g.118520  ORF Transcript_37823/g.118520 Transcript_37823/m.118520 type:complete len:277 (+) Transcript_37823:161-991(+)|eukprot:CAMPEP_0118876786 /NCGR_PEP_ID=MMETSP1163-20130328/17335_1 /TAXON_ID=124430 /ORGANISM="Phaeomonas parva, Strain CCMP2877" /LENGTH=276 /DNA_ID=CAMNT_0006812425 /DNA_START=124 /DNA_END=954 /DNA_ORIENTATION=+